MCGRRAQVGANAKERKKLLNKLYQKLDTDKNHRRGSRGHPRYAPPPRAFFHRARCTTEPITALRACGRLDYDEFLKGLAEDTEAREAILFG